MTSTARKAASSQGFQEELGFPLIRVAVICQLSAPAVSTLHRDGTLSMWLTSRSSLAGVGAGACCGADCTNIGAFPGAPIVKRDKLPQPMSRAMRSVTASNTRPLSIGDSDEYRALQGRSNAEEAPSRPLSIGEYALDERGLAQRATGGQNPNPWGGQPAPEAAKWNVSYLNVVCILDKTF